MDPTEQNTKRLIELLSRGWDGALTDADNAEIDDFLRKHGPEGGEMLLKVSAIHLELGNHVASAKAYERAMASIGEAACIWPNRNAGNCSSSKDRIGSASVSPMGFLGNCCMFVGRGRCAVCRLGTR